jgi:hypothetical protein
MISYEINFWNFMTFFHALKSIKIWMTSKCSFPSPDFQRPQVRVFKIWQVDCLAFQKQQITQVLLKLIRIQHKATANLVQQSSKLGGSPKPVACKIVHGRIKWVVPQVRRTCEKKSNLSNFKHANLGTLKIRRRKRTFRCHSYLYRFQGKNE